ncbi:MAG: GNAT family N-acetyltransferase [Cyclobacteriaceae bacterium]|nr:GNAT family N-acetyltransferase [Cyclobacteriaceae bacterium]
MNPVLREATLADIDQLQKIGKRTFIETFEAVNTKANMEAYLNEGFSYEGLKEELINTGSLFYFATLNNTIVGYLKVNFGLAQKELQDENALEIERIYVLRDYQGKNIGRLLFNKALQLGEERKASYVWLGVWEHNARAMAFYKKNGFVEFDKHVFKLGDDEQIDIMMKLELKDKSA